MSQDSATASALWWLRLWPVTASMKSSRSSDEQAHPPGGADGGGAGDIMQQRDLAETVAGGEIAFEDAVLDHLDLALVDQVEAVAEPPWVITSLTCPASNSTSERQSRWSV